MTNHTEGCACSECMSGIYSGVGRGLAPGRAAGVLDILDDLLDRAAGGVADAERALDGDPVKVDRCPACGWAVDGDPVKVDRCSACGWAVGHARALDEAEDRRVLSAEVARLRGILEHEHASECAVLAAGACAPVECSCSCYASDDDQRCEARHATLEVQCELCVGHVSTHAVRYRWR